MWYEKRSHPDNCRSMKKQQNTNIDCWQLQSNQYCCCTVLLSSSFHVILTALWIFHSMVVAAIKKNICCHIIAKVMEFATDHDNIFVFNERDCQLCCVDIAALKTSYDVEIITAQLEFSLFSRLTVTASCSAPFSQQRHNQS